jgi:hypothetical protein
MDTVVLKNLMRTPARALKQREAAPFVATGLVAGFGTPLAPAFYLMGVAVVSAVVVVLFFRETKDLSLSRTTVL